MNRMLIALIILAAGSLISGCRLLGRPDATEESPRNTTRRGTLIFVGDIMSHKPQVRAAELTDGSYNYEPCFRYVKPFFDSVDLVVVNLETTLSGKAPFTGYPMFRAPSQLAFDMHASGVDVAVLANNHICDNRGAGIRSTINLLDSAGIAHTGVFVDSTDRAERNPLICRVGGLRFALLNYTYGTNGITVPQGMHVNHIDTAAIAADIRLVNRDSIDFIAIYFHWGDEYKTKPNREQRWLAEWTRKQGVEVVVGCHPHVVQSAEAFFDADSVIRGVTVYSLGNFISNQRKRYTNGGMTVRLDVSRRDTMPVEITPSYMLTWVDLFYENDRKNYRILTPAAADTLLTDEMVKEEYELFVKDSRKILSTADGFTEF